MRIVSLTCSNTEIVEFLGRGGDLVGVDDHSDWPPDLVADLPRVGPDLDIDVEKVKALEPDLVLASLTVPGHEKVVERVDAAGLPFLAPAPQSVADVARDLVDIAEALGCAERGRELAAELERRLAAVRRDGTDDSGEPGPSVLVQWWPKPVIAPGRRSWVQGLLDLVGGVNPLDEDVESRPLEDEEVVALAPDVVALSWCGVEAAKVRPEVVRRHPAFADLPVVRDDRVVCIPEAWLGRPSPRIAWGAWAFRRVVDAVAQGEPMPEELRSAAGSAALLAASGRWPDSGLERSGAD